ncbi:hypothetical protein D3C84_511770 [compost metagenome]
MVPIPTIGGGKRRPKEFSSANTLLRALDEVEDKLLYNPVRGSLYSFRSSLQTFTSIAR